MFRFVHNLPKDNNIFLYSHSNSTFDGLYFDGNYGNMNNGGVLIRTFVHDYYCNNDNCHHQIVNANFKNFVMNYANIWGPRVLWLSACTSFYIANATFENIHVPAVTSGASFYPFIGMETACDVVIENSIFYNNTGFTTLFECLSAGITPFGTEGNCQIFVSNTTFYHNIGVRSDILYMYSTANGNATFLNNNFYYDTSIYDNISQYIDEEFIWDTSDSSVTFIGTNIFSALPTFAPTQPPTNAPSISPSVAPSDAPTGVPTNAPSMPPSISPSNAPTGVPTDAPTSGPTETKIECIIYMYYNDHIGDPLSLNIHQYATDLANGTVEAFKLVMNDTTLNYVCNKTDPNEINCDLSNYNPFSSIENRRIMLNNEYFYKLDSNKPNSSIVEVNGWWQARIENLHFCVVLNKIEWDPNRCELYDSDRFENEETFASQDANFFAFGTFDIVADENVNKFDQYFRNKMNQNDTKFYQILDGIINKWFRSPNTDADNRKSFELVSFTISDVYDPYVEPPVDLFERAALDLTFGLYGFMAFCVLVAICANINALFIGADNVKPARIIFFGIWVWDFMSDLIFSARALEQEYFVQGILSLIFVIIPCFLNVFVLIKSQRQWTQDNSIKYTISRWLLRYNKKLIFLTLICGSAFAAIDLCNSRAFGMFLCVVYSFVLEFIFILKIFVFAYSCTAQVEGCSIWV